jgi:hypothetical protein
VDALALALQQLLVYQAALREAWKSFADAGLAWGSPAA